MRDAGQKTPSLWKLWGPSILRSAMIPILGLLYLGATEWQKRADEATFPPFPEFTLPMVGDPASRLDSDRFAGRAYLAVFWASWCIPCQKQRLILDPWVKKNHLENQVLGIATLDQDSSIEKSEASLPHPFPSVLDPQGAIILSLKVQALPFTALVDERGKISRKYLGPLTAEDLKGIESMLKDGSLRTSS